LPGAIHFLNIGFKNFYRFHLWTRDVRLFRFVVKGNYAAAE
jgi:hypothetical protein